jgi:hypothetical protein
VKVLILGSICSLLIGCGFYRGPEYDAAWMGKVSIQECIYWDEPQVKKCTEIESSGFSGWDALSGTIVACLTTGKCW